MCFYVSSPESGRIEFNEFRDYYLKYKAKHKGKNTKDEIMCAFKFFDKNDNGYIEEKEIKEILRKLGDNTTDEQIKQMIECADVDKDGQINYAGKVTL